MRTHLLVAVLVPAHTTIATIDGHLAKSMRYLMPGVVDRYRLGGVYTGAWDPGYAPQRDSANWRVCTACAGSGQQATEPCATCEDAEAAGRPPGTVIVAADDWRAHSGDIVPLTAMLTDSWRFPTSKTFPDGGTHPRAAVPGAYADPRGSEWLSGDDIGTVPRELRWRWDDLLTGARAVEQHGAPFDPAAWSVAVVDGHYAPDGTGAVLPVVGSVVLITDPDFREEDTDPEQLYVVSDDVHVPYYQLVRLGDYGPMVPGFAITEIDPARVVLKPAQDDAAPYSHTLWLAREASRRANTHADTSRDTAQGTPSSETLDAESSERREQ